MRDDVQIAISHRYQDDVNARFASRELAKAMQNCFIAYELNDSNMMYDSIQQEKTALIRIMKLSEFPSEDIALIDMLMQNTPERVDVYLTTGEQAVGQDFISTYDPNEEIEDRR